MIPMGAVQGHIDRMRFYWGSIPSGIKYLKAGIILMVITVVVALNVNDYQSLAYLGLVALIGLALFGIGAYSCGMDLYSYLKRKYATR